MAADPLDPLDIPLNSRDARLASLIFTCDDYLLPEQLEKLKVSKFLMETTLPQGRRARIDNLTKLIGDINTRYPGKYTLRNLLAAVEHLEFNDVAALIESHAELPFKLTPSRPVIKVLVLAVSQATDAADRAIAQWAYIKLEKIQSQHTYLSGPLLEFRMLMDESWTNCATIIATYRPHIIHFICHGQKDVGLIWVQGITVTRQNILDCLERLTLQDASPPAVILSACNSDWMVPESRSNIWVASPVFLRPRQSIAYHMGFYKNLRETGLIHEAHAAGLHPLLPDEPFVLSPSS